MPPSADNADPVTELEVATAKLDLTPKTSLEMVQQLVERGITEVPAKFIQPEHQRAAAHRQDKPSPDLQIPVIDMAGLDGDEKDQVMNKIAKACEEWGFFQVVNHGIAPALMEDMKKLSQEFFALSPEEKEVNIIKSGGTVGYGRLFENSKSIANWVDRLTIWSYGEPQILAEPCMPPKPERASEVIDKYAHAVVKLSLRLIEILSEALGLEPDVIGDRLNAKAMGLRTSFNFYPPCPQPELVFGIGAHADSSVVTVLQQDIPGLEIAKDGMWVQIPPLKDALVINMGDMMQILSNGRYKSVLHRAITNQTVGRYTFPNFFVPTNDTIIEPIKELISKTNPALYKTLTFGEYIKGFHFRPLNGRRHIETFLISN